MRRRVVGKHHDAYCWSDPIGAKQRDSASTKMNLASATAESQSHPHPSKNLANSRLDCLELLGNPRLSVLESQTFPEPWEVHSIKLNVTKELAALQQRTMPELRARFAELFGETTRAGNRPWLVKRIIWRLQALAEGDLSERARHRAAELANDADLRLNSPPTTEPADSPRPRRERQQAPNVLLQPGTVLTRVYKGEALRVSVLANGFEFEGQRYASLTAVAKAITGTHTSGFLFFGLAPKGGKP